MKTHKKKQKTDSEIRKAAAEALNKVDWATRELNGHSQEEADQLMSLLRECQKHISELEFVARKGYAIMRRAYEAATPPAYDLPANTGMSLADFQKEVKRQAKAYKKKATEAMKKVVDQDYLILNCLEIVADAINDRLNEAVGRGFALN